MPAILATWKAEIGRIVVRGQPGKKVNKTTSQPIAGHGGMCLSFQATWEAEIRRIMVPGQQKEKKKKKLRNPI
jgi:hypothetical protein